MTYGDRRTRLVMRVVAFANGAPCPIAGQYLKSFDFNAYDGRGFGEFTFNLSQAMKFDSARAAMEFWRTISNTHPVRGDGKPNRPLTATTMEFESERLSMQ